jgi:hypothetical protein
MSPRDSQRGASSSGWSRVAAWAASGAVVACGTASTPSAPAYAQDGAPNAELDAAAAVTEGGANTTRDAATDVASTADSSPAPAPDGGVVLAQGRTLAMEINPPTTLDYATEVGVATGAGVTAASVTLPWSTLESSAPDGGASQIDTSLFGDLEGVYASVPGFALLISIPLVDTASVQAPPDLQPSLAAGTLAFDDPTVVRRYETLVDALFANLPGVEVSYLLVANEENLYLASKPAAQWTALASFYSAIKAYVATKRASVTVGMNVAFAGLVDSAEVPSITSLLSSSPDVFVSYYGGDTGSGQTTTTTVSADVATMVTFAGSRPLILKELGYATGTTGDSTAGQVGFLADLFAAWDAHAAQIPMVTISRMFDGNLADCASEAETYGEAGNEDFIEYLCTLGLRTVTDTPKPAWGTLAAAAGARGF